MAKYHKQHYNFVAKRMREAFESYEDETNYRAFGQMTRKLLREASLSVVVNIAIDFAQAFKEDNPQFDPEQFLDACSPDKELYPLHELWPGA